MHFYPHNSPDAVACSVLLCAWREYASENRRNAKLLAACGAGGILAGTTRLADLIRAP